MCYTEQMTASTVVGERSLPVEPAPVRKPRSRVRPRDAPTHVRSVALRLTPSQRKMVDTRLHVAVRFYNSCLSEAITRLRKVRADPAFAAARLLPKGGGRTNAFRAVDVAHGFTESGLTTFASGQRVHHLREHVLAQEAQLLGSRAFAATERWKFGTGGRPRFKSSRDGLRSLSGKDNCGSLRPKVVAGQVLGFQWGNGNVFAFAAPRTTGRAGREQTAEWAEVRELILDGKVLRSAIVTDIVRGRTVYRVNLTMDGPRPQRHPIGTGIVSLDMGPSNVAVVVSSIAADGFIRPVSAEILPLAPALPDYARQMRVLLRTQDRQHRAGSPDCFDIRGRHVKGSCHWRNRSAASIHTRHQITEMHRVQAAYRKTSHGSTVNRLLAAGSLIHTEKLNYVAWQKNWPRSVRDRAPGLFIELCRGKAESAGGGTYEYSTYTTALSQTCLCGTVKKKTLAERVHRCDCGITAHRDLFSAFLGTYVRPVPTPGTPNKSTDLIDADHAHAAWSTAHDIGWLPASVKTASKKRRGQVRPSSRSMARINARRKRAMKSTETLGKNLLHLPVTASDA